MPKHFTVVRETGSRGNWAVKIEVSKGWVTLCDVYACNGKDAEENAILLCSAANHVLTSSQSANLEKQRRAVNRLVRAADCVLGNLADSEADTSEETGERYDDIACLDAAVEAVKKVLP